MTKLMQHWHADAEQSARAKRFEAWLVVYFESLEVNGQLESFHHSKSSNLTFSEALKASDMGPDIERHLLDYFSYPLLQQLIPNERHYFGERARVCYRWLEFAVNDLGADYAFDLLLARLRFQLHNPRWTEEQRFRPTWIEIRREELKKLTKWIAADEDEKLKRIGQLIWNPYLAPDPLALGWLVMRLAKTELQVQRWFDTVFDPALPTIDAQTPALEGVDQPLFLFPMSSAKYMHVGSDAIEIAERLEQLGLLSPVRLAQLLGLEPPRCDGYLLAACLHSEEPFAKRQGDAMEFLHALTTLPTEQALAMLGDRAERLGIEQAHLVGAEHLYAAARLVGELAVVPPPYNWARQQSDERAQLFAAGLFLLCNLRQLSDGETQSEVAQKLQRFPSKNLEALFPHAGSQAGTLLEALKLEQALPLFRLIKRSHQASVNQPIDRAQWLAALASAVASAAPMLKLLRSAKIYDRSLKRLDAMQGTIDKRFAGHVEKLSQEHLRCVGLLPLEHADQLRERFDALKKAAKEATKKFGNERSQNVKDAVQCGLENLARNAGFADATELEWSLEARLNQNDLRAEYDGYTLQISFNRFHPELVTTKAGKALKAVPPALKKVPSVSNLLEHFQAFKGQSRRFRDTLEQNMVDRRVWPRKRLSAMLELPLLASMLQHLILISDSGLQGVLDNELGLVDQQGTAHSIIGNVRIAHVFDLLAAGTLSAWQQRLIELRLVQPFKQAFRECYVLTPAEREAKTSSARFANRRVVSKIAAALFTARSWRLEGGESEWVAQKRFADAEGSGYVQVDLPDVYHYLSDEEHTQLGFVEGYRDDQRIDLEQLPSAVFSEAMRDLDLIITAGAADSNEPSVEVQERRIELVQSLIPTLGLKKVRVEDQFAYIEGKRADYRLHLGTAVIHIQPAGYLCIVPADAVPAHNFALPFVDEDRRTSEVLSKLMMLSADHLIKDKSILMQIHHEHGE
jgi:hypothetical protein